MNEFDLIDRIVECMGDTTHGGGVVVGPGDDCAVVEVPSGHELLVTTDVLVEGRHFPAGSRGDVVGYRAIAVNLSDLAAMGATARYLTVATTLEQVDEDWVLSMVSGMTHCAREFGAKIIGGNLSAGPLSIAVTAHGTVPAGTALLRSGARADDDIYVTGSLGASLHAMRNASSLADLGDLPLTALLEQRTADVRYRYYLPEPRLELGTALRTIASAAIDVSDGLYADLSHIADASELGAQIDLDTVPAWDAMDPLEAIGASDDYEIVFTAAVQDRDRVAAVARTASTVVSRIGTMNASAGVVAVRDGKAVAAPAGFQHF